MKSLKKLIYLNLLLFITFAVLVYYIRDQNGIWIGFYTFGCTLFGLLFYDGDQNPDKTKKDHKILRKIVDDDGIFEYTETGFYIWENDLVGKVEWMDIQLIVVSKVIVQGDILTELLIQSSFSKFIIDETMHGWEKFVREINRNLNINNTNWSTHLFALQPNKPFIIYQKYGYYQY